MLYITYALFFFLVLLRKYYMKHQILTWSNFAGKSFVYTFLQNQQLLDQVFELKRKVIHVCAVFVLWVRFR